MNFLLLLFSSAAAQTAKEGINISVTNSARFGDIIHLIKYCTLSGYDSTIACDNRMTTIC
jgi:hypothetical protein